MANEKEVLFQIKEHIGVIATYPTGWTKEINIVSWNGAQPKYDIRDWDFDHNHMSRGITLRNDEMSKLIDMAITYRNKKVVEDAKSEKKAAIERSKSNPRPFAETRDDGKKPEGATLEVEGENCSEAVLTDEDGVVLENEGAENKMSSDVEMQDKVLCEADAVEEMGNAEAPF